MSDTWDGEDGLVLARAGYAGKGWRLEGYVRYARRDVVLSQVSEWVLYITCIHNTSVAAEAAGDH